MGGCFPSAKGANWSNVLRSETATPEQCWFCIWEGLGFHDDLAGGRVRLPNRDYMLYTGPIELALVSLYPPFDGDSASPNLWWPDDRTWIVVTEIDYVWTYVGGSAESCRKAASQRGARGVSDKVERQAVL